MKYMFATSAQAERDERRDQRMIARILSAVVWIVRQPYDQAHKRVGRDRARSPGGGLVFVDAIVSAVTPTCRLERVLLGKEDEDAVAMAPKLPA